MRKRSLPPRRKMSAGIFTRAERIMALNNPLMQFCVYAGMVFVLSYGSYTVITGRGLDLNVGQMSSMLTYSFQILMSPDDGIHWYSS